MVAQYLDFNMPRFHHLFFEIDVAAPERAEGLARGVAKSGGQILLAIDTAHALAAPAGRGLEQNRKSELAGSALGLFKIFDLFLCAGDHRSARGDGELARCRLRSHSPDGLHGRADENDSGFRASLRKFGVFAQESVARMDRFG